MRFHPLADLFPLIEGAEFNELVTSIRENGQREPIVIFEDAVLDGRNRYRACEAAGVEPVTQQFPGGDPVHFVIDHNLRRRHLNESQRAMIAARLTDLAVGRPRGQKEIVGIPTISQTQAAAIVNVSRDSVLCAKTVLRNGTPEEIKAVQDGNAAVSTLADAIRKKIPASTRLRKSDPATVGKNPQRFENARINGEIWARTRDALDHLTSLPLPSDVAAIGRGNLNRQKYIDAKLARATQWLTEFSNAWNSRNG